MLKYRIEARGKIIDDRITSPLVWTNAQATNIVLEQWPHKQEIPWWIIMVCSFAALFLLYLIVLILIKVCSCEIRRKLFAQSKFSSLLN